MSQPPAQSGRHRAPRGARVRLLPRAPRPGHRGLLKTLGGVVAAVGVAAAFGGPGSPAQVFALADSTTPAPDTSVSAPHGSAPALRQDFGVIGFRAAARPGAEKRAGTRSDRTDRAASRGIRRTGLAPELGLTQHGLVVLNAIRDEFPQIHSFGGYRAGDMDHGTGNAVDTMVSSRSQGDAVAGYVMAHAGELDVKYVIWYQRIWYPGSGTWKPMQDRGGPTANHLDHVHVSVN